MANARGDWNGETLPGSAEDAAFAATAPSGPRVVQSAEHGGSAPSDHEGDVAPTRIADRYRIVERLGMGGYGIVYRAVDERIDRPVAVKVLSRRAASSAGAVQRFRNEALSAGRLAHPGIVAVSDFETMPDGRPYIVMELVQGETLAARLRRQGRMRVQDAVAIMLQICAALDRVHGLGIVHRDLTPANVMLVDIDGSERPAVKVLDFGIAKLRERAGEESLTQNGQLVGTPAYMAPEQARAGSPVDARTDLYAAGIILYELVGGALPFSVGHVVDALVAKLVDDPKPLRELVPDLPRGFAAVVMAAMARERTARVASAAEWAAMLRPFLEAPAEAKAGPRPARRWVLPAAVVLAAAGALAIAGARGKVGQASSTSGVGSREAKAEVAPPPPLAAPPTSPEPARPSAEPPAPALKLPRVKRAASVDPLDLPDAPVRRVRVQR